MVIGVPNRWDPFLRPLLVVLLYRLGLYGYGFEKSYSRRTFRRMLTRAGFEVTAETGIGRNRFAVDALIRPFDRRRLFEVASQSRLSYAS